jgi:dTDP-glucose pyrophosphorylase
MLNIVIPMAGAGSRFALNGYKEPKPLIPIHGMPMIQVVIQNLTPTEPHQFIFICQRTHAVTYGLKEKLSLWAPSSVIVEIDGITEGAACTVLAAKSLIDNDSPLMIANSDQYVEVDINTYLRVLEDAKLDGLIMTMCANDPKWSYVGLSSDGDVNRVVEKQVISNEATVGIYNFRNGHSFVQAAEEMIANNQRVNGEFYVAPTYNNLIANGHKVGIRNIGSVGSGMHGLGTPSDLQDFLTHLSVANKQLS